MAAAGRGRLLSLLGGRICEGADSEWSSRGSRPAMRQLGPAAGLVVAPEMAARVVSVEVHEIADLGFAPWCEYQMRHINGSAGISKR